MGVSEQLGGAPSLTAVFTILTGITGAVSGGAVLDLVRVRDRRARGLAIGVVAHGIRTARTMQVHPTSGAFAGWAWLSTPSPPHYSIPFYPLSCRRPSG
jgi:putative effector of murein hydrolase